MKRRGWIWLAIPLLAAALVAAYLMTNDNARDRRVWARFQQELIPENVTRLDVGHGSPIALTEEERGRAVALLAQGRFQRSNREGHGPTAETILTLHFSDGRTEHIGFWGGETFELSPRHLDQRSQFLVTSPALGEMIKLKTAK